MYYFVVDRAQFALVKLYHIRVPLNRANCSNFQTDKRNLDIAVGASSNRLFYDLLIIIFVRGKADYHYYRTVAYLGFSAPGGNLSFGAPTQPVHGSIDAKNELGIKRHRTLTWALQSPAYSCF